MNYWDLWRHKLICVKVSRAQEAPVNASFLSDSPDSRWQSPRLYLVVSDSQSSAPSRTPLTLCFPSTYSLGILPSSVHLSGKVRWVGIFQKWLKYKWHVPNRVLLAFGKTGIGTEKLKRPSGIISLSPSFLQMRKLGPGKGKCFVHGQRSFCCSNQDENSYKTCRYKILQVGKKKQQQHCFLQTSCFPDK